MQGSQIMNKLISANYWFGCDWWFYEVGYLGMRAGQLSLACAGVYDVGKRNFHVLRMLHWCIKVKVFDIETAIFLFCLQ